MNSAPVLPSTTEDFFTVYGFPFVLRTEDAEARNPIVRLYRRFLKTTTVRDPAAAVIANERPGFRWALQGKAGAAGELGSALWGLESALCEAIIRSQQRLIAVHAATLDSGNSAVMLIGRSGSGKSTLSVALSKRGLVLGADDVAFVDPQTLNVHPMPRCLHLDQNSVRLLEVDGFCFPDAWRRCSFVAPDDLDNRCGFQCRAGLLIYVHDTRAEHPHLKEISQSEMAGHLWSETGQAPHADSEIVNVLATLAGGARCFDLTQGPLSETADAVANLVSRLQ
jgi:hypothetical protein